MTKVLLKKIANLYGAKKLDKYCVHDSEDYLCSRCQLLGISGQIFCYVTAPTANIIYLPSYWRNSSQLNYDLLLRPLLGAKTLKMWKTILYCEINRISVPRLVENRIFDLKDLVIKHFLCLIMFHIFALSFAERIAILKAILYNDR